LSSIYSYYRRKTPSTILLLSNFVGCFVFILSDYTNFPNNDKSIFILKSLGKTGRTVLLLLSILVILIIIGLIYTLQNRYSKRKNNNNNNRHHTGRLDDEFIYSKLLTKNKFDLH